MLAAMARAQLASEMYYAVMSLHVRVDLMLIALSVSRMTGRSVYFEFAYLTGREGRGVSSHSVLVSFSVLS